MIAKTQKLYKKKKKKKKMHPPPQIKEQNLLIILCIYASNVGLFFHSICIGVSN